jgi:hypothetical protein
MTHWGCQQCYWVNPVACAAVQSELWEESHGGCGGDGPPSQRKEEQNQISHSLVGFDCLFFCFSVLSIWQEKTLFVNLAGKRCFHDNATTNLRRTRITLL